MLRKKFLTVGLSVVTGLLLLVLLLQILGPRYLMALMMRFSPSPADLNTATTRATEQMFYTVPFASAVDPIVINQMYSWTLYVENADGKPIEHAVITVDGRMPHHSHGLPTQPQVTQILGSGDY